MRINSKRVRAALLARVTVVTATAVLAAACSMDVTRFDSNPFNNRQDVTNSVRPNQNPSQAQIPGHQLPQRTQVETQPLHNPAAPPPNAAYRPNTVPAAPAPQAYRGPKNAPATTASVYGPGKTVIVRPGETIYSLSRAHRVPVSAIIRANSFQQNTSLRIGQRVVIPGARTQANAPAPAYTPIAAPAHQPRTAGQHVVGSGDTIYSLSRRYRVSPQAIASANNLTLSTQLRVGQRVTIPGNGAVVANAPRTAPAAPQRHVQTPPPAPQTIANTNTENAPQPETVGVVRPQVAPSVAPEAPAANPNAGPSFRWPVRGRIISAFGRKPNGQQNDGINLSVPEGTPIRAAEDGVVAYAGNELKGFGNLVLIRHADNWVTAYAHTSAIEVKKDQKVKRGDVIARAGQTGGVTSPQLHFEIRKGSSPVDPEKHLSGT